MLSNISQEQIKSINTLLDKTKSLDISDLNDLFSMTATDSITLNKEVLNKFNTTEVNGVVGFFREFGVGPFLAIKVDENNFIYRDNEKAYLVDCGTQLKSETNLKDYSNLILKVHSNLGIE